MSVTQFTAARAHLTALWQDLDHEQDTNGTKEHAKTLADLLAADKALACHAQLVEALRMSISYMGYYTDGQPHVPAWVPKAREALKAAGVSS